MNLIETIPVTGGMHLEVFPKSADGNRLETPEWCNPQSEDRRKLY